MNEGLILIHHGVKGQKWGIRNDKKISKKKHPKKYSEFDRKQDMQTYGKRGVKRIEKRMQKGSSHLKASMVEAGQQALKKSALSVVMSMAYVDFKTNGSLHRAAGQMAARKIMDARMRRKAVKSIIKITQNKKYNPIDVAYTIMDA